MKHIVQKWIVVFILLISMYLPLASEQMHSPEWGFTLDLPEGFVLSSSQDGSRFQFEHSMLSISMVIAAYPKIRYENASMALENAYSSLQLQGGMETISWYEDESSIGIFTMDSGGVEYSGWAVSVLLPGNKGTSVFLCYSPSEQFYQTEQVIVSALDSIDLLHANKQEAGILTSYAYSAEGVKKLTVDIGGKKIVTEIDSVDIEASEFVVQREYAILSFFASTPLWKEAWQRFYRVIFRDSYTRLSNVSNDIYDELAPTIANDSSFDVNLSQALLSWVQGFEYLRIPLGTDFVPLPAAISGTGSDCDSRALLLSVIMRHMGYNTTLFVSREYGHALFGVAIEGQGAKMDANGTTYLLGETTASVALGLVPQDMSETSKWIAIDGM